MQFCPFCKNYLYLSAPEDKERRKEGTTESDPIADTLLRICRTCGYKEEDKKGGLVLETNLQERTSEGYKILLQS